MACISIRGYINFFMLVFHNVVLQNNFHTDLDDSRTQKGRGGSHTIHPMSIECTGNEEKLSQCERRATTILNRHYEKIYCEPGMYTYYCDIAKKT